MKKNIFFIVFLFCLNYLNAQTSEILVRKIVWNQKTPIIQDENQMFIADAKYLLSFENAVYSDISNLLPHFSEQIYINKNKFQNYDIDVKLANQNFIALTSEEINGVSKLENISNDIVLDYNISISRGISYLVLNFIPIIKDENTNTYKKLTDFEIIISPKSTKTVKTKGKNTFAQNSVLSSGNWVKIKIEKDGIYKLTYQQLEDMGFSSPQNVRVFGNDAGMLPFDNSKDRVDDLKENKIYKGSDYILFYAKGTSIWNYDINSKMFLPTNHLYSDYMYYFLTDNNTGFDNTIKTENQSTLSSTNEITTFDNYKFFEEDKYNLINSGRQWYGESFKSSNVKTYDFKFPNIVSNSDLKLKISTLARSSSTSTFNYVATNFNQNVTLGQASAEHSGVYAVTSTKYYTYAAPSDSNIGLSLTFQGNASADAWIDYIVYNAICNLTYTNSQFHFRNINSVAQNNVSNFTLSNINSNVLIWDITNSCEPESVNYSKSGSNAVFKLETNVLKQFVAFEISQALEPVTENNKIVYETVENQNLHSTSGSTDMIILTHKNFLAQAEEIAQIHRDNDNLNVTVVTNEQVYNEFSSGTPDVSAIKYFAKMVYERGSSDTLKYLLLFGDGSYNNKEISEENKNFILTYQSLNSLNDSQGGNDSNNYISFVSDDYFGFLDDDEYEFKGALDIGIGRMPVKSTEEANVMVDKLNEYLNKDNMGDWKNTICFIADDEDSNIHMEQADKLSIQVSKLAPELNAKKIYIDAYQQVYSALGISYPDATNAVNNQFEKGALIINYTGHGSPQRMTHEGVIMLSDIKSWSNLKKLPLVITATCEVSRYDQYSAQGLETNSAGELILLNPNGGAIAMLTTSRLVYSGGNMELNTNFFDYTFEKNKGAVYALGDLIRLTKNATGGNNKFNFTLLGDPALKLLYPEYEVATTKINGIDISETDTLNAFETVTIEGVILDKLGNTFTNFNGTVYPTVFDKEQNLETQNNDNTTAGPFKYIYQNNVLYKGKASVINGNFQFTFIVPKDILYNYGYGRISYYADNNNVDANGYSEKIFIGGTSENIVEDKIGPEIKLYMNNELFVDGDITNENPAIYAMLSDENGINTVGNGVGHDITAILDTNTNYTYILNDYYEADIDSYKSGIVTYNLSRIKSGEHNIKFKAWDIYNNSSEAEINFLVMQQSDFVISRLFNYPNPFTTKTSFYFEHNQSGNLEVLIQIFTVSGKLVKTLQQDIFADNFKSEPIEWDGYDDYGSRIGKGVYIYRIKIKNSDGLTMEKFEKLLILK